MPPLREMPISVDRRLDGETLHELRDIGHGHRINIVDASYDIPRGARVVKFPGTSAQALEAVVRIIPIEGENNDHATSPIVVMDADAELESQFTDDGGTINYEHIAKQAAAAFFKVGTKLNELGVGTVDWQDLQYSYRHDMETGEGFYTMANGSPETSLFIRTIDELPFACASVIAGHSQRTEAVGTEQSTATSEGEADQPSAADQELESAGLPPEYKAALYDNQGRKNLIEELSLGVRAYNILKSANYHKIFDVVTKSEQQLLDLVGVSPKSVEEIVEALQEMGLELRPPSEAEQARKLKRELLKDKKIEDALKEIGEDRRVRARLAESEAPSEEAAPSLLEQTLAKAMDDYLVEREYKLLELRFGLDGQPRRTIKECVSLLGLTTGRIGVIQNQALRKLEATFK